MSGRGVALYRGVAFSSATPARLLDELYNRALLECGRARARIVAGDVAGKAAAAGKILEIVAALQGSLDHRVAPELAENLGRLYTFIEERVLRASIDRATGPLEEAERILSILHDGFRQAALAPSEASR